MSLFSCVQARQSSSEYSSLSRPGFLMSSLMALLRQNSPPAKAKTPTNVAGSPTIGGPVEGRLPISPYHKNRNSQGDQPDTWEEHYESGEPAVRINYCSSHFVTNLK